jgi:hypothetical protein
MEQIIKISTTYPKYHSILFFTNQFYFRLLLVIWNLISVCIWITFNLIHNILEKKKQDLVLSTALSDLYIYLITCLLTYLITYSMEQSPSWEANWFCS